MAIEHDLPFVCIPAGTRNHFALDLGLNRDDPRLAMAAFRGEEERHVDSGRVSGLLFVNNVSLGLYATIVQSEEYLTAEVTPIAARPATAVRRPLLPPVSAIRRAIPDHRRE